MKPSAPLFFMADSHAGIRGDGDEEAKLRAFGELLDRVESRRGELWILGDLFDFWFEWAQVIPKRAFPWLARLRACVERGCPVHLLPGNHDFRLRGFLESTVGVMVHDEPSRLDLPGLRLVMHHGDGLDPGETGYRLLRALIRNRLSYALFTLFHPDWGMALADRSGSRDRNHRWDVDRILAYLEVAGRSLLRPGDGLLLLGHSHRCVTARIGGVPCVVLPPFLHPSRGYLCLEQGRLQECYLRPDALSAPGPSEGLPAGGLDLSPTPDRA